MEALRKKSKDRSPLPKERLEDLIAWSLCQGFLAEKFHFTPYSTIPFLSAGVKMSDVVSGRERAIMECAPLASEAESSNGKTKGGGQKRKRTPEVVTIDEDD